MPAKKSRNTGRKAPSTTAMFPSLHEEVSSELSDEPITPAWRYHHAGARDESQVIEEYDTNIMGTFRCRNPDCPKGGWGSKKIGIHIRRYPRHGYNAVVYKQRCKACNALGVMEIDKAAYLDRITYRLKKWSGVWVEPRGPREFTDGPEHESDLCEACKAGHCSWGMA